MLKFVEGVAQDFNIGPNDVQIGVDTFSTSHKAEFHMNSHLDKQSLVSAISHIPYKSGSTHTGQAIQFMHTDSFTSAAGIQFIHQTENISIIESQVFLMKFKIVRCPFHSNSCLVTNLSIWYILNSPNQFQ